MNDGPPPLERLTRALTLPTLGVAGLVDELLSIAADHNLRLEWHAGRCLARSPDGDAAGSIDVPLAKPVFRALLARVAALCDEQNPGAVSPYGGEGEIATDPRRSIRACFINIPGQQSLELAAIRPAIVIGADPPHRAAPIGEASPHSHSFRSEGRG